MRHAYPSRAYLGMQQPNPVPGEVSEYIIVELPEKTVVERGDKVWQPVKDLLRRCVEEYVQKNDIGDNDLNPAKVEIYSRYFASCRMLKKRWAKPCYGQWCYDRLLHKRLEGSQVSAWFIRVHEGQFRQMLDGPRDPTTGKIVAILDRAAERMQNASVAFGLPSRPDWNLYPWASIFVSSAQNVNSIAHQHHGHHLANSMTHWILDMERYNDIALSTPSTGMISSPSSRSSSVSVVSSALACSNAASPSTTAALPFNANLIMPNPAQEVMPTHHDQQAVLALDKEIAAQGKVKVFFKPPRAIEFRNMPISSGSQDIRSFLEDGMTIHKCDFAIKASPAHRGRGHLTVTIKTELLATSVLQTLARPGVLIGNSYIYVVPSMANRRCLNQDLQKKANPTAESTKQKSGPVIVDGSIGCDLHIKL